MNKKNNIDLAIITNEPFPIGMAATNRIISYASKIANVKNVKIFIATPTELPDNLQNTLIEGIFKKIEYQYVHGYTEWPKESSRFTKVCVLIKGIFLVLKYMVNERPNSIIMAGVSSNVNSLLLRVSITLFAKMFRTNIYQEMSEYPPVLKNKRNKINTYLYLKLYEYVDGIIVMTKELSEYFASIGQTNTFHLPMTVDFERFSNIKKATRNTNSFIFTYCGGGNYARDGLLNIVNAFIEVNQDTPNFVIEIICPINRRSMYFNEITEQIKKSGVESKIKLIGRKSNDKIPEILINSDCLIMAPPKNFDSGGFPTKLGEYLASGNPVICTKVSEIPLYLNDKSALLVEPNNHQQLVDAIKKIIHSNKEYVDVGKNGRFIAAKHFSAEKYNQPLMSFLKIS